MTTDIFLRSYSGDIAWVPWALRSLDRFVTGIRNIIIVVPANDYEKFKGLNLTREILCSSKFAGPGLDDYLVQQIDKLCADSYTDADQILFFDSDCIAIRKFSPSDLLLIGRPRWLMTNYRELVKADGTQATPWKAVTEKAVKREVEFEMMRMHPFLVTRAALDSFQEFMARTHNKKLDQYILEQPNRAFSEWNALGAWAYYFANPRPFSFWPTDISIPEPFVRQFWSWGGLTPEIQAEMEKLLA